MTSERLTEAERLSERLSALEAAEAADTTDWRAEVVTAIDREARAQSRRAEIAMLRAERERIAPLVELGEAWAEAEAAVREHMPGAGFGVMADGPGYRAHAGHPEWYGGYVEAWSVADIELVGDAADSVASAALALTHLTAKLREAHDDQ